MSIAVSIENLWSVLGRVDQFQMGDGLFKTFRVDYSPESCLNDYIDEENAMLIETRYDHAFITEILLRLGDRFPSSMDFEHFASRSVAIIRNAAILAEHDGNRIVRWRHYDIPHKNGAQILPEIDNTGRCLTALIRYNRIFRNRALESMLKNEYNYRQFGSVLRPIDNSFRLTAKSDADSNNFALLTYFGNKPDNDIDPVCNIAAITPTLMFLNRSKSSEGFEFVEKVADYLRAFILSDHATKETFEYYESSVLFYVYSKFAEFCRNETTARLRGMIRFDEIEERLLDLLLDRVKNKSVKNSFEASMLSTSMMALGYSGKEVDTGIEKILNDHKHGIWNAYRFYRQRHPHRIFGSRGLSTAVCLEAMHYYYR